MAQTAMPRDLSRLNARYGDDAEGTLRFALSGALGRLAMVSSFGAESAVLLHMVAAIDPATPVLFIDTLMLFPETMAYQRELAQHLGLSDLRVIAPDRAALFALAEREEVESRLLQCGDAGWKLRHGPLPRRALPPIKKPFAPSAMVLSISLWSAGALNLPCSSYGVTAATKKPPISCIFFMRISPFYPRNGTRTPCVTM